jgi:hypothetical protein
MFFLLRMAFWLGIVLLLLPRDNTDTSAKAPQIGPSEAVSAASAAVSDMGQFCTRQPAACEVGSQAAKELGHRAQSGAKKLIEIITDKKPGESGDKSEKKAPDHTGSIATVAAAAAGTADTLTAEDLQIEWSLPQGAGLH